MKNKILFLIFALLPLLSFADESTKNNTDQPTIIKQVDQAIGNDNLSDRYYKLLYENEVKYNEQIIETMQWSISLVSGFIILLVGGQMFYNSKINKEEINLIKSDLSEKFTILKHDSSEKNSKVERKISERIHTDNKSTMSFLSTKIEEKFTTLRNENMKSIDFNSSEIVRIDSNFKGNIQEIRQKITELEAHSWKLRGVEANALRSFLNSAEITLERGFEEKFIFGYIKRTLEAMEDIEVDDYKKIKSILEKVKSTNSDLKKEIQLLCEDLSQYMYVEDPRERGKFINVPLPKKA
ncbi:MAG: hypothetical protein MJK11_20555 [Pseudomonadales bacterium]|nr:hypothetical protein [Pseudomonadales bacterium]